MATFDRAPPPPDCLHPVYQLQVPMSDAVPGTVPRFVVSCSSCKTAWTGGQALSRVMESMKAKLQEIEQLVRTAAARR